MFEAEREYLSERGVVMEDTVVEPDGDSCVTLAVHNYNSTQLARLKKGHILGSLQVATVLPVPTIREEQPAEQKCTVKVVQPTPTHEEGEEARSVTDPDRTTHYWINSTGTHRH